MALLPIRYAASGPIIGNAQGGEALPGVGFQLRLDDGFASTGALVLSGSQQAIEAPAAPFIRSLSNPKPNLRYSAEANVCLQSLANAPAVFRMSAQFRVDGGAWQQWANGQEFDQVSATNTTLTCSFYFPLLLGSALPAPVLVGSSLLEVQFTASVQSGAGQVAGNHIWARLIETL